MVAIPNGITNASSPSELLDALLSMSDNVSHESVILALEALTPSVSTSKMGTLVVGAAISVKKVLDVFANAAGLNLPEEWLVEGGINMSMFAMAGHLMFLLPESSLTAEGKKAKTVYVKSLGGSVNILEFGTEGNIPAKAKRTSILREWSERLAGADMKRANRALARAFPNLVRSGNSFIPFVGGSSMLNPFALIRILFKAFMFPLEFMWNWKFSLSAVLLALPASRMAYLSTMDIAVSVISSMIATFFSVVSAITKSYLGIDFGQALSSVATILEAVKEGLRAGLGVESLSSEFSHLASILPDFESPVIGTVDALLKLARSPSGLAKELRLLSNLDLSAFSSTVSDSLAMEDMGEIFAKMMASVTDKVSDLVSDMSADMEAVMDTVEDMDEEVFPIT